MEHADYPHLPGTLYDCMACESRCYCGATGIDCVHCGIQNEMKEEWKAMEDDTDSGETIVLDEEPKDESF